MQPLGNLFNGSQWVGRSLFLSFCISSCSWPTTTWPWRWRPTKMTELSPRGKLDPYWPWSHCTSPRLLLWEREINLYLVLAFLFGDFSLLCTCYKLTHQHWPMETSAITPKSSSNSKNFFSKHQKNWCLIWP